MADPRSCPHCGAITQPTARFCSQCSQPLQKTCSHCGNVVPVSAQFCNQCGTRFAPSSALPSVSSLVPQPGAQVAGHTGRLNVSTLVVGRYLVQRKLGQGGMGAVYLVQDQRLGGKPYALKEMSEQGIIDPTERQAALVAFGQEAQMLAALDHANLPKVTDFFEENGNQYLVMEFVQGETLETRLERTTGPLPEALVRKYAEQLCDVLDYLHRRQPPIIFRDLKPANIMLLPDDKLKLIDFGIARHFKPGKSKDTQAMGTPGYAAPEQYGKGQSDQRTDIYALGALMHHMLTARDPSLDPFKFAGPRSLNPVLSASIDKAVVQAVDLDPNRRWQSIRELRNLLMGATGPASFVSAYPAPTQAARMATQAALPPATMPQMSPVRPAAPMVRPVTGTGSFLAPGQPLRVAPPIFVPQAPYMQTMPAGLLGKQFAGYGQRVGAYLVDTTLLMVLYIVVAMIATALFFSASAFGYSLGGLLIVLFLLTSLLYMIWPTAKSGQTLGKKMVGIRVVDDTGNPPGWGKAILRQTIGFWIEGIFFSIGLLWPLWDDKKQTWHDKIANTYVVQK